MKKWARRLVKIGFVIFALGAIFVTILINMGGDSHTLKRAMEDYISQATGYAAKIETLNKMTFYPNISFEAEGVHMIRVDMEALRAWSEAESQKPENERGNTPAPKINYDAPDGTIEKLIVSMGFWDVTFGLGRKVRNLYVQNASFKAGTISHKPITIETIEIDETPEGKPFIIANGAFGNDSFRASVDLEGTGRKKRRKYEIGEESEFHAEIGKLTIQGVLRPRTMGGFHARDVIISNNGKAVIETTLSFVRNGDKIIELDGDFMLPEHASNATIDWKIDTKGDAGITGTMDAFLINTADFLPNSELSKMLGLWNQTFKKAESNNNKTEVSVKAKKFVDGEEETIPYKGILEIENNQFNFKATP